MIRLGKDRSEAVMKLYKEADAIRAEIAMTKSGTERDESMLDLYLDDKWSAFMQKILEPEMVRLAKLRMAIHVDAHDDHIAITGQYKEAQLLARGKEQLEIDIDNGKKSLYKLQERQLGVQNKINKLKE